MISRRRKQNSGSVNDCEGELVDFAQCKSASVLFTSREGEVVGLQLPYYVHWDGI